MFTFEVSHHLGCSKSKYASDLYPNARCIIECSEVFIDRPLSYQARAQTYSNYKKHNTVNGVTPNGTVSFLLKCWE